MVVECGRERGLAREVHGRPRRERRWKKNKDKEEVEASWLTKQVICLKKSSSNSDQREVAVWRDGG